MPESFWADLSITQIFRPVDANFERETSVFDRGGHSANQFPVTANRKNSPVFLQAYHLYTYRKAWE
jgi:hypothetical protein